VLQEYIVWQLFIKLSKTALQEDIVWQRNTSQNETYRSNTSHLLIILTPI
jgi:hypothetical protein